jgi:hypothetical protein
MLWPDSGDGRNAARVSAKAVSVLGMGRQGERMDRNMFSTPEVGGLSLLTSGKAGAGVSFLAGVQHEILREPAKPLLAALGQRERREVCLLGSPYERTLHLAPLDGLAVHLNHYSLTLRPLGSGETSRASPAAQTASGSSSPRPVDPFPDGNGRIARFLMNLLLALGGVPLDCHRSGRSGGVPGYPGERQRGPRYQTVRYLHSGSGS